MTNQEKYLQFICKKSLKLEKRPKLYRKFHSRYKWTVHRKVNANYTYLYERMLNLFHNKRNVN